MREFNEESLRVEYLKFRHSIKFRHKVPACTIRDLASFQYNKSNTFSRGREREILILELDRKYSGNENFCSDFCLSEPHLEEISETDSRGKSAKITAQLRLALSRENGRSIAARAPSSIGNPSDDRHSMKLMSLQNYVAARLLRDRSTEP